jgi:hypothetical protein
MWWWTACAPVSPDVGEVAAAGDALPPPPRGVRVTLTTGQVVEGEVLAAVDHRLWWTPQPRTSWLVYDPRGRAPWPGDRSVRAVRDDEVARVQWGPPPRRTWRDRLRADGVVLTRLPLDLAGPAWVMQGNDGYHLEEGGFGTFAVDLAVADATGATCVAPCADLADFLVWDAPVALPLGGVVTEVVSTAPDNPPGTLGTVNNLVGVRVDSHLALYLLHLRQGSVPAGVTPGKWLPAGTVVGRVGNAGVTLEPHLHVALLYLDVAPVSPAGRARSWSVPIQWGPLWHSASLAGPATWVAEGVPRTGTWVGEVAF